MNITEPWGAQNENLYEDTILELQYNNAFIPILVVGNKLDLVPNHQDSDDENGMNHTNISAIDPLEFSVKKVTSFFDKVIEKSFSESIKKSEKIVTPRSGGGSNNIRRINIQDLHV